MIPGFDFVVDLLETFLLLEGSREPNAKLGNGKKVKAILIID